MRAGRTRPDHGRPGLPGRWRPDSLDRCLRLGAAGSPFPVKGPAGSPPTWLVPAARVSPPGVSLEAVAAGGGVRAAVRGDGRIKGYMGAVPPRYRQGRDGGTCTTGSVRSRWKTAALARPGSAFTTHPGVLGRRYQGAAASSGIAANLLRPGRPGRCPEPGAAVDDGSELMKTAGTSWPVSGIAGRVCLEFVHGGDGHVRSRPRRRPARIPGRQSPPPLPGRVPSSPAAARPRHHQVHRGQLSQG